MIGRLNTGAECLLKVAVVEDCKPSGSRTAMLTVYSTAAPVEARVKFLAIAVDAPGATGSIVADKPAAFAAMLHEYTSELTGKAASVLFPSKGNVSTVTAV